MEARTAFRAIQRKLEADPRTRVLGSVFDELVFGNFWIAYEEAGERMSVVNDRGQLILYGGSAGDRLRAVLISELGSADENAVLGALS